MRRNIVYVSSGGFIPAYGEYAKMYKVYKVPVFSLEATTDGQDQDHLQSFILLFTIF